MCVCVYELCASCIGIQIMPAAFSLHAETSFINRLHSINDNLMTFFNIDYFSQYPVIIILKREDCLLELLYN